VQLALERVLELIDLPEDVQLERVELRWNE
jgi:hypothetical protein